MICRSNYEPYLIDYLNHNLSAKDCAEVEAFLLANPDIANEFDGLGEIILNVPQVKFEQKNSLKKPCFEKYGVTNEADYLCIANLENDLNTEEQVELDKLKRADANVEKLSEIYAKTKLAPDTRVTFSNKLQLKRHTVGVWRHRVYRMAGTAAAVAIIAMAYQWQKNSNNNFTILPNCESTSISIASNKVSVGQNRANADEPKVEVGASNVLINTQPAETTTNNHAKAKLIAAENTEQEQNTLVADNRPIRDDRIKPIDAKVEPNMFDKLTMANLNIVVLQSYANQPHIVQQEPEHNRTKEYNIKDWAIYGLRKAGNILGIKSTIEYGTSGKITRFEIESGPLAFTSTKKKNR